jgi:hypothetical protein
MRVHVAAPDPEPCEAPERAEHNGPEHNRDDCGHDEYFDHEFPKESATGAPRATCTRREPAAGAGTANAAPGHWPGGVSSMSVPPD